MAGTSRTAAATAALREGRPVIVFDDADRENEADVILSAATVTPEWLAWTVRETTGLLCAPMSAARADALELPPMVARNEDPRGTAYTVTVDARHGVGTGVSARDRCRTARVLADAASGPADLVRPGHVLPLRARDGGVLVRPGHTEACVDLCELAGLPPVGMIAELVSADGSMMGSEEAEALAASMRIPTLTIAELIEYCRVQPETATPQTAVRVRRAAEATIGTAYGDFRTVGYRDIQTGSEHVALISGTVGTGSLVRVHSECLTGEVFHSGRCECGAQLASSMARIAADGGVVVYLRGHEGRGIGLLKKIAAYRLQDDDGLDTVAANLALDEPVDAREYGAAAAILHDLGAQQVQLMTNNPDKVHGLESGGIRVATVIPLIVGITVSNVSYMDTKRRRMGHEINCNTAL